MKKLLENITKNELVELTAQEQHDILQYCKDNTVYMGRGSSRATFEFKEFSDIVIKIVVDSKGEYQKDKEIEIYKTLGSQCLTRVYAYGDYFAICEKVEPFDHDEVISYVSDYLEDWFIEEESIFTKDDICQIQNVVEELDEELGETSDNCQLGRSVVDGRIVSYDFGYESGSNSYSVSDQLSYVCRFFEEPNMLFGYLLNEVETDYGFIQDRFHVDFYGDDDDDEEEESQYYCDYDDDYDDYNNTKEESQDNDNAVVADFSNVAELPF